VTERRIACVIGSMDLVRPLALAGIRSVAVCPRGAPASFSRHVVGTLPWTDPWERPDELVDALLGWARAQDEPPLLLYEEDRDLLLVSRARDRLASAFRFLLPERELVEDCVDKGRFAALAERLSLPVPRARRLGDGAAEALAFPLLVKPLTRRGFDRWRAASGGAKAVLVRDADELAPLEATGLELLAQEAVPGPETRVESYHAYVSAAGEILGEFTGRKIRTRPARNGISTALELTDAEDVGALGRDVTRRLGLVGVLKLDFKRDDGGTLRLLEANPRFTLWHHLGAVAGVNLPALVAADLNGARPASVARARPGTTWCFHLVDAVAAHEQGVPLHRWVWFAARCDAISTLAWDDPLPFFRGVAWRWLARRARR
jgi:predicted ATP-grasp superfamily ATP-dependent carboligase